MIAHVRYSPAEQPDHPTPKDDGRVFPDLLALPLQRLNTKRDGPGGLIDVPAPPLRGETE